MAKTQPVTAQKASDQLRAKFGKSYTPDKIQLEYRGWRWLAFLPDGQIAFFADTPLAVAKLAGEKAVLERLSGRVGFSVPEVIHCNAVEGIQIRSVVPGIQLGGAGREALFAHSPQGEKLARDLGQAMAELHGALSVPECHELGLESCLPASLNLDLSAVTHDQLAKLGVAEAARQVIALMRCHQGSPEDEVFVHGDLWAGNIAVNPVTGALGGIFDFDEMGLGDRCHDLRFLPSFGAKFMNLACDAYADRAGLELSILRIQRYHALAAIEAFDKDIASQDAERLCARRDWLVDALAGV